jgi:F0F1-type ATP synthase membrane subunit c/vacuolar-type H+-ATPase subunit K
MKTVQLGEIGERNVQTIRMILLGLAFSVAFAVLGRASGQGISFTSAGIASLRGRDICSLQGEFPKHFGVYLDDKKEHSVVYRERDGVIALFLVGESQPSQDCGIVDAVLDLTPLVRKGEEPLFKCHVNSEGRTRWGHVVGLGDNQSGHKRFLTPRLAWRVDTKEKRFDKITEEAVSCDASGYIVGNGWY